MAVAIVAEAVIHTEESFSPQRQKTLVSIENHIKIKNTDSKAASP